MLLSCGQVASCRLNAQKQAIERIGRHWRVRQHGHLRAHARIDDDRPADDLLDLIGDHADVRVAIIRRELWALRLRFEERARKQACDGDGQ
jgi:hypothetical protein